VCKLPRRAHRRAPYSTPGDGAHVQMTRDRNAWIAASLREAAELLQAQDANRFRVQAYRRAATTVENLDTDAGRLLADGGVERLEELPGIGRSLGAAIAEMVRSGRWTQLDRLRGAVDPISLFREIPGVGPELARELHETLQVDTLEALETAAHEGRLSEVSGIGPRRAAMIRSGVKSLLGRPRGGPREPGAEPPVADLLAVDQVYRDKAEAGELRTIAPRRFNPSGEAWLPILHTERDGWHYTALYSNTERAHELGTVKDWVVLYFHRDDGPERQRTVVTERRGPLAGRRVVRGREPDCRAFYGQAAQENRQAAD